MKLLDVAGTGIKAAAVALAAPVAKALRRARLPAGDRDAAEELKRRARINARGEARREEFEAALFGGSSWLPRRSRWLERGR